ncbi:hypothetical protein NDU88_002659 [Pleurodeles waltl]|uniref:Uncharacterized protein n=1 Tax=Pleurodeles waltl TaxID=8319 RepID=A0AAV7KVC9_PLEWA|nr:hypothetical protein NDU88_002659 [Pleurodeles waltl]
MRQNDRVPEGAGVVVDVIPAKCVSSQQRSRSVRAKHGSLLAACSSSLHSLPPRRRKPRSEGTSDKGPGVQNRESQNLGDDSAGYRRKELYSVKEH